MNVWVEPTRRGEYRVRMRLPNGKKLTLDTLPTLAEANFVAAEAIERAREKNPEGLTVAEWVSSYVNIRDMAKELDDAANLRSMVENHIRGDALGRMTLRLLRREHVVDWTRRLRTKKHGKDETKRLSRGTVTKCLVLLRTALAGAIEKRLVRENPAEGVVLPRERRTEDPWTYLAPEEVQRLVASVEGPQRWVVAFAIGTGLRAGELVSLRLSDVHADGPEPHVYVRYGGAPTRPTKSGKPRRVPLFGIGLQAWREWLAALPTVAKNNPLRLAFPGSRGGYRCHKHVLRWATWTKAVDGAELGRNLRWHDLRHTCASSLVSGFWGRVWTLAEVQQLLGHESITTTERYAHVAESLLKNAANATEAAPLLPHTPSLAMAEKVNDSSGAHDGARTRDLLLTKTERYKSDHWENRRLGVLVGQAVKILRRAIDLGDVPEYAIALAEEALAVAHDVAATERARLGA
jgi:integrase